MIALAPSRPRNLQRRLLDWFDRNRRDLPWRRPAQRDDPYRIWLAEIMLQQTRVPVVLSYYRRFLGVFPTVRRLAAARRERVLALWAGLGYYQRARNLHRAAQEIVRKHAGPFPTSLEAALALPGVGPYTARAVLSIACGQPHAVVDGNVARVLARLFRLRLEGSQAARARLQPLADRLVSRTRPGDFNQALMELGSTICLPRRPRCRECPLERLCAARCAGIEQAWPPRPGKRRPPVRRLAVLVLRRRGRWLVTHEAGGLFSGLWHFPYARRRRGLGLPRALRVYLDGWARLDSPRPFLRFQHGMTTGNLDLTVFVASRAANSVKGMVPRGRWVTRAQLVRLGVGAATRKILTALNRPGESGV